MNEPNQQISDFCKWVIFEKQRHRKDIFDINELFIQRNTDSYCEHITGCVNIYLYLSHWPCVCAVSSFVSVWNRIRVITKKHTVSDLSKLDALLHKT